jgi:hypothetical protein
MARRIRKHMQAPVADPALRRLIALQRAKGGARPSEREIADTSSDFRAMGDELRRAARRLGGIIEAWDDLVPAFLRDSTRVDGFERGTLSVTAESSATLYALDREMRAGLEAALRDATGGRLHRVRGRIGRIERDPDPDPDAR